MKITLKTPCDECPFRRESLAGYLGPWDVEGMLWEIGRSTFPCHKTIVRDGQSDDNTNGCAGAAIFLNNKHERSRHWRTAEHQDAVMGVPREVRESVFKWGDEFRAHHSAAIIPGSRKRIEKLKENMLLGPDGRPRGGGSSRQVGRRK